MDNLLQATVKFCNRLDAAGIRYVIGGSVAAGMWGEPRQTNDVDVEVWVDGNSSDAFLGAFGDSYIVSGDELGDAMSSTEPFASVQVLDSIALLKFDCFLRGLEPIDEEMFGHSTMVELDGASLRIACAEHILVQKLRWYELGNRVSERQWRDMQGIVRVNAGLNWPLVERWATAYGVASLVAEINPALHS